MINPLLIYAAFFSVVFADEFKCKKNFGFDVSQEPMDRTNELAVCRNHESRTCCTRDTTKDLYNVVKQTYQHSVTGTIMSEQCRSATIENWCSICDADVGVGLSSSGNKPSLCYSQCVNWYNLCKNDLFEPSMPGFNMKPCISTSSHLCSTPAENQFCTSLGFNVFPEWTESSPGVTLEPSSLHDPLRDLLRTQKTLESLEGFERSPLPSFYCFDGQPAAKRKGAAKNKAREYEYELKKAKEAAEWAEWIKKMKNLSGDYGVKIFIGLVAASAVTWWVLNSEILGLKKNLEERKKQKMRLEVRLAADRRLAQLASVASLQPKVDNLTSTNKGFSESGMAFNQENDTHEDEEDIDSDDEDEPVPHFVAITPESAS